MSGRRPDAVWCCFDADKTNAKVPKAVCKGCSKSIGAIVARMRQHADVCTELHSSGKWTAPVAQPACKDVKVELKEQLKDEAPAKRQRQGDLPVVLTSAGNLQAINKQLCRFIVATNSPFAAADHPELDKLVGMLRPGVKLACSKTIRGPLLDELFAEERTKLQPVLHGELVTLAIDGWSSVTNQPVIGVHIGCHKARCLVETVDTAGERHTGEYLHKLQLSAVQRVQQEFGVTVSAVVTDNASNMEVMRGLADDSIFGYGCQAHVLNLTAADIGHAQARICAKIVAVLKAFRNQHALLGALQVAALCKPPLPAETRWTSARDSFVYYQANWARLVEIAGAHLPLWRCLL